MTFNYAGNGGQPQWLWGTGDGVTNAVWNPSNFSVAFATNSTNATNATNSTNAVVAQQLRQGGGAGGQPMTFNWAGQSGMPPWVWGGSDGANMYVYDPSQFSVAYAGSAGSANAVAWTNVSGRPTDLASFTNSPGYMTAAQLTGSLTTNGWYRVNGMIIQWGRVVGYTGEQSKVATFPLTFPNACLNVVATYVNYQGTYYPDQGAQVVSYNQFNTTLYMGIYGGGTTYFPADITWIAIGY